MAYFLAILGNAKKYDKLRELIIHAGLQASEILGNCAKNCPLAV
jgi:hypothetical protein